VIRSCVRKKEGKEVRKEHIRYTVCGRAPTPTPNPPRLPSHNQTTRFLHTLTTTTTPIASHRIASYYHHHHYHHHPQTIFIPGSLCLCLLVSPPNRIVNPSRLSVCLSAQFEFPRPPRGLRLPIPVFMSCRAVRCHTLPYQPVVLRIRPM
jgi:hypothetical protein